MSWIQNLFAKKVTLQPFATGTNIADISNKNGTGSISIDETPTIVRSGDALMWDDLRIPLSAAASPGINLPAYKKLIDCSGYSNGGGMTSGLFAWHFTPISEQELTFFEEITHKWKEGDDVYPHVHFVQPTTAGGNVIIGLEYGFAKVDQSLSYTGPATTHRESDGTTKKVWFGGAHGFRKYRQIVVSGLGGVGYNGDNNANTNIFIITNYSNAGPDYWIEYTGSASSVEAKTPDVGGVINGFTYRQESNVVIAANAQGFHRIVGWNLIEMDIYEKISTLFIGRVYRIRNSLVAGGMNADLAIVMTDLHLTFDTEGSRKRNSKF